MIYDYEMVRFVSQELYNVENVIGNRFKYKLVNHTSIKAIDMQ